MKYIELVRFEGGQHPKTGLPLEGLHYAIPGGSIATKDACQKFSKANQVPFVYRDLRSPEQRYDNH